jgi:very-short-patch-repair endonuclease
MDCVKCGKRLESKSVVAGWDTHFGCRENKCSCGNTISPRRKPGSKCRSCSLMGHKKSETTKEKLRKVPRAKGKDHWNYGNHTSDETKEKMSNASKGRTPWNKGLTIEDERVRLNTERAAVTKKEMIKNGEWNPFANLKMNPRGTKIEGIVKKQLDELEIKYETQFRIENRWYDFLLPDQQILIEVDGEYWHNYPDGTDVDREKEKMAKDHGYKLVRIWGAEVNSKWRIVVE